MKKYALHIGINYTGTEYELGGCLNDATDWASLLTGCGFDVAVMAEKAATKRNMICGIETIVTSLKAGDVGFISYSGHGTWVPDLDGDEPDGKDEALCPIDCCEDQSNILLDDELHLIFNQIPAGAHVVFVADSCHSGTVFRLAKTRLEVTRARFLPQSYFMKDTSRVTKMRLPKKTTDTPVEKSDAPLPGLVHFSGCRDAETSNDAVINGRACGAFSYFATRAFTKCLKMGGTYGDAHKEIRKKLPSVTYVQTPLIVATALLRKHKIFVG